MKTLTRRWARTLAPFLVLAMLGIAGSALAGGRDILQFERWMDQALETLGIPGLTHHSQLPEGLRQRIHRALQNPTDDGPPGPALVLDMIQDEAETLRRAARGAGKPPRSVRAQRRAAKGGGAYSVGIGLVIVAGTAWATGELPTAEEIAGGLPVVGIPITIYAIANEIITDSVDATQWWYEQAEMNERIAEQMWRNMSAKMVNRAIRNLGQMCVPISPDQPPPCREIRAQQLLECLAGELDLTHSRNLVRNRSIADRMRLTEEGVLACYRQAITFESQ